jgi:hypothetical protein
MITEIAGKNKRNTQFEYFNLKEKCGAPSQCVIRKADLQSEEKEVRLAAYLDTRPVTIRIPRMLPASLKFT